MCLISSSVSCFGFLSVTFRIVIVGVRVKRKTLAFLVYCYLDNKRHTNNVQNA